MLNEFLKKSIAFGLFFSNLPPTIMIPIPTKNIIKPNPLRIKPTSAGEKKTNALIITGMQIAINAPKNQKSTTIQLFIPPSLIPYGSLAGFQSN